MKTEKLLEEYFDRKDQIREMKKEREQYDKTHTCIEEQGNSRTRCYWREYPEGTDMNYYCDICKERRLMSNEIQRLSYINRGCMMRIRNIIKRLNNNKMSNEELNPALRQTDVSSRFIYLVTNETDRIVESAWSNFEEAKKERQQWEKMKPQKEFMVDELPINGC